VTPAGGPALVVSTPGEVLLEQRGAPQPAAGELLIEPELVGLCGTDLEIIDGTIDPAYLRYPLVLGHEWTGMVAGATGAATTGAGTTGAGTTSAAGPGADGVPPPGTRVVVEGIIACGHCLRCLSGETNLCETYDEIGFTRDGAAARHAAVPARLVHPLAPAVSADDAVLIEPMSVVFLALSRAGVRPGSRVLVIGDGTIALLAVYLLGLWSPAQIVLLGRREGQAELAAAAGAAAFVTDTAAAGTGFDLVVEAAGATDAVLAAFAAARRGGTVVLIGLPPRGELAPVAVDDLVNNDLTIKASFSYTSRTWSDVVTLLNTGRLRPGFLITHRFGLGEWETALATLRGADSPRGKVLLRIKED
jgi:threonine dehydrogenase-like Zn-dependent dehydrogenase